MNNILFLMISILSSNYTPFEDTYGHVSSDNDPEHIESTNLYDIIDNEFTKKTSKKWRHIIDMYSPLDERIKRYKKRLERKMREQNLKDIKEKERLKNRGIYDVIFDCIRLLISNYFNVGLFSGLFECIVDLIFSILTHSQEDVPRFSFKIILAIPLMISGAFFGALNPVFGLSNGAEYGYKAACRLIDTLFGRISSYK